MKAIYPLIGLVSLRKRRTAPSISSTATTTIPQPFIAARSNDRPATSNDCFLKVPRYTAAVDSLRALDLDCPIREAPEFSSF
jgi:hypothetical protein